MWQVSGRSGQVKGDQIISVILYILAKSSFTLIESLFLSSFLCKYLVGVSNDLIFHTKLVCISFFLNVVSNLHFQKKTPQLRK